LDQGSSPGADGAGEKAKQAAGQAQQRAGQVAGEAKSKVSEQVGQRSTDFGQQVSSNAGDVRSVAEQLREQGKDGPAKIADQAADRAERLGSWLEESDGDRIVRDVEDFGRKNPWAVALGGLAVGFAASRMLKASSNERYESSRSQYVAASSASAAPGRAGYADGAL